ncbi:TPA: ATP-binding protein [Enterobacter bugandensis]|nr:ATP-binding protein [Enterobacter bugandensis]
MSDTDYDFFHSARPEEDLEALLSATSQVDDILQRYLHQSEEKPLLFSTSAVEQEEQKYYRNQPRWVSELPDFEISSTSRLGTLCSRYALTSFEMAVILLGCMHRLEPAYRRYFNTLTQQQSGSPTFELALAMFCPGQGMRNAQRISLLPDAPLLDYGLLECTPRRRNGEEQAYTVSDTLFSYLTGYIHIPDELTGWVNWLAPTGETVHGIGPLLSHVNRQQPLPPLIEGRLAPGVDAESWVADMAQTIGSCALWLNWPALLRDERNSEKRLTDAINLAQLVGALLVVQPETLSTNEEGDAPQESHARRLSNIVHQRYRELGMPLCCLMRQSDPQLMFPELSRWTLHVTLPDVATRTQQLKTLLGPHTHWDYPALTRRVALSLTSMRLAIKEAEYDSAQRGAEMPQEQDFRRAFLRRARQNFGALAQRIEPRRTRDALIISEELNAQLTEITTAIRWREYNPDIAAQAGPQGISALFHGDPGTGKTLAAESLAHELGVDLIRVDLSTVVNKYIGETEKNLARIFDLAAQDAGVLFFDEADALFGKRSETKDAKDRHANIEIAYLLQRIESHPGLVILATNHRGHLDDAFSRRFTFITRFPYPDVVEREKMWQAAWPQHLSRHSEVDAAQLARLQLTGANIRNITQLAGWLADEEGCLRLHHIEKAIKRELAKMGRTLA